MDIQGVAIRLRQLAVNEWLENSASYQEFMMDNDIKLEAPKFLSSGFYHSDLADTMVLSLANALEATITVFSSVECHPLFCVTPRKQITSTPIMIAFTQFGSGHYDGVLPKQKPTEESIEKEQSSPLKNSSVMIICVTVEKMTKPQSLTLQRNQLQILSLLYDVNV